MIRKLSLFFGKQPSAECGTTRRKVDEAYVRAGRGMRETGRAQGVGGQTPGAGDSFHTGGKQEGGI